jgi:hypothetical protein
LRDALREAGHPVAYAVLRAPLGVCVSRARGRESRPLAEPGVVERLWRDFADLGALEPHAVDAGAEGPDEVADLLDSRLREGSLRA